MTPRRAAWGIATLAWLLALAAAQLTLWRHLVIPGSPGLAPLDTARGCQPVTNPALILFAHPHCPCTAATLDALAWVDSHRAPSRPVPITVVLGPLLPSDRPDPRATPNGRLAAGIPRARILGDPRASLARRFGVATSGHVLLLDAEGRRRFSGGITPGRGHLGDSLPRSALLDLLRGRPAGITTFPVFGCPLASNRPAAQPRDATAPLQEPPAMPRILLVEDNEMNRDMLARRLARKGYEVDIAADGQEGHDRAQAAHYDLILMDLDLPILDGWELTRRLKADPATAPTPVVALTAHAMAGDREQALAAGCDDYDTKPVDFARLLAKIEALLAR